MKRTLLALPLLAGLVLTGCSTAAEVASENLSTAAEEFEVERRIVFFNGITDTNLMEIVGRCSIEDQGNQLEVTCKIGDNEYKKDFLGLSDNVSYFVEQVGIVDADEYRYRVVFRPEQLVPAFDLNTSNDPNDQGNLDR